MEIGQKIKQLRMEKGLSMYRITQITGISGHHIKGVEEGTRQPTLDTLQKLLVPLGISMAELFNAETESSYLTSNERKLIENYRKLSKEKADALVLFSEVLNK